MYTQTIYTLKIHVRARSYLQFKKHLHMYSEILTSKVQIFYQVDIEFKSDCY